MVTKRRWSNGGDSPPAKRTRTISSNDHISPLSSELLIRILHHLPLPTLLICQSVSHRFYTLTSDSQIWKSLYYSRFVLPRALRIPGIKRSSEPEDGALRFSSHRSKWLDEGTLVNRKDGGRTDWKRQYKLRHNWSRGACEIEEIRVRERASIPGMLVKLAEGCVVTVEREDGLRAWGLKGRELIAGMRLGDGEVPTCVAVDEGIGELGIVVGFEDGGWGTWRLDIGKGFFQRTYTHPGGSNGLLSAVACSGSFVLTITEGQLLSLYTFTPAPEREQEVENDDKEGSQSLASENNTPPTPHLLASLNSHTCWPPLSLSIRLTPTTIIASIAYSFPTYLSGYTIGLQELHISPVTGLITSSRLTSALPQGFSSLIPTPASPSSNLPPTDQNIGTTTQPTSLSYAHPYILATHPDNTLSLYLCTSTSSTLHLSPGTKLWGHTSSVSSAEITARGKAVSVSTRGNELRVWSLEGGFSGINSRKRGLGERSIRVRHPLRLEEQMGSGGVLENDVKARKHWVGFDDEVVIVLKEDGGGRQVLVVYDFT